MEPCSTPFADLTIPRERNATGLGIRFGWDRGRQRDIPGQQPQHRN